MVQEPIASCPRAITLGETSAVAGVAFGLPIEYRPSTISDQKVPVVQLEVFGTAPTDPTLAARASHETRWLREMLTQHPALAVVAGQAEQPTGPDALATLFAGRSPTVPSSPAGS